MDSRDLDGLIRLGEDWSLQLKVRFDSDDRLQPTCAFANSELEESLSV